jgi:hypothetical protein
MGSASALATRRGQAGWITPAPKPTEEQTQDIRSVAPGLRLFRLCRANAFDAYVFRAHTLDDVAGPTFRGSGYGAWRHRDPNARAEGTGDRAVCPLSTQSRVPPRTLTFDPSSKATPFLVKLLDCPPHDDRIQLLRADNAFRSASSVLGACHDFPRRAGTEKPDTQKAFTEASAKLRQRAPDPCLRQLARASRARETRLARHGTAQDDYHEQRRTDAV